MPPVEHQPAEIRTPASGFLTAIEYRARRHTRPWREQVQAREWPRFDQRQAAFTLAIGKKMATLTVPSSSARSTILRATAIGRVGDDAVNRIGQCGPGQKIRGSLTVAVIGNVAGVCREPVGVCRLGDRAATAAWIPNHSRECFDFEQARTAPARLDVEVVSGALEDVAVPLARRVGQRGRFAFALKVSIWSGWTT